MFDNRAIYDLLFPSGYSILFCFLMLAFVIVLSTFYNLNIFFYRRVLLCNPKPQLQIDIFEH